MQIDRKELKRRARELMARPRPSFWVVALVYLLLTTGLSNALDAAFPIVNDAGIPSLPGLFFTILMLLFTAIFSFGYLLWCLRAAREEDPDLNSLMGGFSMVSPVILTNLGVALFMLLFALMAILPMSVVIWLLATFFLYSPLFIPLVLLVSIGLAVYLVIISYRYILALYLLADAPERGVSAAIRHSVELMNGWKWEYFKLSLSFFGWYLLAGALEAGALALLSAAGLLGVPTLAALMVDVNPALALQAAMALPAVSAVLSLVTLPLMLWLTPYMSVATALFYDARLTLTAQSAPPVLPPDAGAPF